MIHLKKSLNKWIPVSKDDKVEFLIDYPSIEQGEKLSEMKLEAVGRYIYFDEEKKNLKIDAVKFLAYKRYLIKCCVKDWKGLDDKCIVENGELNNDLWWALVMDTNQTNLLYELISAEVDFTEDDKKKLDSANTLPTTG